MNISFICYEDGKKKTLSMRDAYRMFFTLVDQEQKKQGTTFHSWLEEMEQMQIFIRRNEK